MIRKSASFLTQLYVLADILVIQGTFLIAWWVKFVSGWLSYSNALAMETYFLWNLVYTGAVVLTGFLVGFYTPKRRKRFSSDIIKIFQVHSIGLVILLSLFYLFKVVDISREFLAIYFAVNLFAITMYRLIVKISLQHIRKRGYNKQFVLILGAGSLGRRFYENLQQYPILGYEVVGFLDDFHDEHPEEFSHYKPIIGKIDHLESILEKHTIDEVVLALPLNAHEKFGAIIEACEKAGVKTQIIPDFFDYLPARPNFDNFAGIPLINVRDIPLDEMRNRFVKRTFDIVFSLICILITLPLLIAIAVGIKLTSEGPIIFKQERVGLNRRRFHMYKFRTMRMQTEEESDKTWTRENDPRVTRFGAFLRRTSLDELPQFFNVLLGHMSIVGPRPERPYFVEQFKDEIPKYMIKHHIRPGITGWAQSNGWRGDTSIKERIKHDLFYIENWSFLLDIKIIFKTLINGFVNRNAY